MNSVILIKMFLPHAVVLLCLSLLFAVQPCRAHTDWAQQVLTQLSLEKKIAQLFMVALKPASDQDELIVLVKRYGIGGLSCFNASVQQQINQLNSLQGMAKIPLLVSQDCETGSAMRLSDGAQFPQQMTLGAITGHDDALFEMGKLLGQHCRMLGVHMFLGPVVDVNTNPDNPIIGMRSFGACPELVAQKAKVLMAGLAAGGVISCIKHWPGHGDTLQDSHYTLPILQHNMPRVMRAELYPFQQLIEAGCPALMTAHIVAPHLVTDGLPATLSPRMITGMIRQSMGFQGLIVTDAMDMHALDGFGNAGQLALQALVAGCDMVLCPKNPTQSIDYVINAVRAGKLSISAIDAKVLRILRIKDACGIAQNRFVDAATTSALMRIQASEQSEKLYQLAVTKLNDPYDSIPLNKTASTKIVFVDVSDDGTQRGDAIKSYARFSLRLGLENAEIDKMMSSFEQHQTVVVRIFMAHVRQRRNGQLDSLDAGLQYFLKVLQQASCQVICIVCTSPYVARLLPPVPTIVAYENGPLALRAAMCALWGKRPVSGTLPI
jgi:beta-N-acetylhexosaminidase